MMWRKFQSSNFLNLSAFENDSKIASLFLVLKSCCTYLLKQGHNNLYWSLLKCNLVLSQKT